MLKVAEHCFFDVNIILKGGSAMKDWKSFLVATAGCLDNLGTVLKLAAKYALKLSTLCEG